ncbi:MAG TPA: hypothetical protein VF677_11955 [Flavobacterium sp.]|jgi:site-specific recombinase XerC
MKRNRISLPNGCSMSTPAVNPSNWKSCTKSALKKDWYISYYFYDPEFPKPKQVIVKGMNDYKTIDDRRNATKIILDNEIESLKVKGYNPYTKKYTALKPEKPKGSMHADLLIIEAFRLSHSKIKGSPQHLKQIEYAINRFEKAVKKLRMTDIKICNFKRSELKEIFDYLNLTDNYFNKFKAYFSSLFKELIEYECCEINLTRDIQKRTIVKNQREVMQTDLVDLILDKLRPDHYEFYRYGKIFFYSGGRSTELFTVQAKHVRLDKQEYDVLIKKGKQYVWETKIIIQNAIPFWSEIIQMCKSKEDYLFSHGLVPGLTKNSSKQITIRWRTHVKKKLVIKNDAIHFKAELEKINDFEYERITADFYSMKHTFLDLLDSMQDDYAQDSFNAAKEIANHRTDKITHGVYTTGRNKRKNEILKKISI